jgi:hypothetical protein
MAARAGASVQQDSQTGDKTMSEIFTLLATFDDPDVPHEIWVFRRQVEGENFLRGWAQDFLGGFSHDANDLPSDAELVAAFRVRGAHVHLYRCDLDGGSSDELVMFERASEPDLLPQQ